MVYLVVDGKEVDSVGGGKASGSACGALGLIRQVAKRGLVRSWR